MNRFVMLNFVLWINLQWRKYNDLFDNCKVKIRKRFDLMLNKLNY